MRRRRRNCSRSWRQRGWFGRRGSGAGDAALFRLPFEIAEMTFKSGAKVAGGSAKFTHHFPKVPRQFRKLLRAENDQRDDKNDDEVGDAKHLQLRQES
jgi:hypothetical protein